MCPLESDRGVNGATQSAIGDLGVLSSISGVWGGAPVANGFWKIYLIEWSSFSSTVYYVRKTVQHFEQVDDVAILFQFQ